jgi:hypothetical protein
MLFRTSWARKRSHASIDVGVNFGLRNAANSPSREWTRFWARQFVFTQKINNHYRAPMLVNGKMATFRGPNSRRSPQAGVADSGSRVPTGDGQYQTTGGAHLRTLTARHQCVGSRARSRANRYPSRRVDLVRRFHDSINMVKVATQTPDRN